MSCLFDFFVKTSFQQYAFLQNRQHLGKIQPFKLRLLNRPRPPLKVYLTNFVPTRTVCYITCYTTVK